MTRNISIQIKATLLLIVFSLNTIIGFACAVGIDMGFNTKHHDNGVATETPVHVHADGNKHDHHEANKHTHDEKKSSEKDDCCNDKVVKFQNAEKNITLKAVIASPAFVAIVNTFFGVDLFTVINAFPQKNIIRFFYPPPPNILVAIQKFQV